VNSWRVNVVVTLVLSASDQVKITTHHHWVLASRDFVLKLFEKNKGSSMVSRAIDPYLLKNYLRGTVKNHYTDEELALVNQTHFKHAIPETQQQTP
jgi:hypothetical protein